MRKSSRGFGLFETLLFLFAIAIVVIVVVKWTHMDRHQTQTNSTYRLLYKKTLVYYATDDFGQPISVNRFGYRGFDCLVSNGGGLWCTRR